MRRFSFIIPVLALITSPGLASLRQAIIPLDHGVLHFSDLTHEMLTSLSVPASVNAVARGSVSVSATLAALPNTTFANGDTYSQVL